LGKSKKIKVIIAIVAISFIQGLQYCVSPVLEQIQDHYPDISVNLVQMLITAPALLSMIVALVSGGLVVKFSKKKLLVFAGFVAGLTGFLPFLYDSFTLLFVSRTLYGVGLGLACTLNTAVVAEFFEGDERVSVMGIQAASIGAGMVVITTMGGKLGVGGFEKAYFVNIIGFISMILIACVLPDTGKAKITKAEKIHLTPRVFEISVLGGLEFLYLITFTTNIAMHLSGSLEGNTAVSGALTGVFSGSQIIIGLILGLVTKVTKKYTLPIAMLNFVVGSAILILFQDNYILLMIAAIFCA
jgi:predicted MFS family arabinose efflux permease